MQLRALEGCAGRLAIRIVSSTFRHALAFKRTMSGTQCGASKFCVPCSERLCSTARIHEIQLTSTPVPAGCWHFAVQMQVYALELTVRVQNNSPVVNQT
jgi:hypothetical protein